MNKEMNEMKDTVVVYDQQQELAKEQPIFNSEVETPYCQLGDEILNADVPWATILGEVIDSGCFTLTTLCQTIRASKEVFYRLLEGDSSLLSFKLGARLLAEHEVITLTNKE